MNAIPNIDHTYAHAHTHQKAHWTHIWIIIVHFFSFFFFSFVIIIIITVRLQLLFQKENYLTFSFIITIFTDFQFRVHFDRYINEQI